MATSTTLPATLGTYCDAAGTTEHDFACLMHLGCLYVKHARYSRANECFWGAFDTARRMARPDLAFDANEALGSLTEALSEGDAMLASLLAMEVAS